MLKTLLFAFVGGVIGAVVVAAVFLTTFPDTAPESGHVEIKPASTDEGSWVAVLEKRLDETQDIVESLGARIAALEMTNSDAEPTPSPNPNQDAPVGPVAGVEEYLLADTELDTTQQEHIRSLSNHFVTQNIDEGWSPDAEKRVHELLSFSDTEPSSIPSATLSSLRCRATLCEGRIVAADTISLIKFQDRMVDQLGTEFPSIRFGTLQQDAGGKSIVFYVARKGYDLPQ